MYDRGYDRGTVLELFRVIDWMIQLPAEAEAAFRKDLYAFETSKQMPLDGASFGLVRAGRGIRPVRNVFSGPADRRQRAVTK